MQQTSSDTTRMKQRGSGLNERDDLILRAVYEMHIASVDQICKLYFSPGSLTHVREILMNLWKEGYLHRVKMPSSQDGVKPWLYMLGREGIRYLKANGYSEFPSFRPKEQAEYGYLHLKHTGGVNDILIAAKALSIEQPEYVLADFLHEWVLKRRAVRVKPSQGSMIGVVPDLWLDFILSGETRASIVVEYDRGTESQKQMRRKIRGLIAFANGPYQENYGSESLTIAIATTDGEHRAELIRSWIENELEKAGRKQDSEVFLVSALPAGEVDPQWFFLEKNWMQAFGTQPVALLEG